MKKTGPKSTKVWQCKYCTSILESRFKLYEHYKICEIRLKEKLDSLGRIKHLDYSKASKTLRKKVEEGLYLYCGHPHTYETRIKLSEKRIKYLEENPSWCKWYDISGVKVQGTWERDFAIYLNSLNIKWERKKLHYKKTHSYTPDFYCPEKNCFFEVKGFRRDRDLYKMYLVLDEYPDINIKMIEKKELIKLNELNIFELPNFQEVYPRELIDESLFNNIWK